MKAKIKIVLAVVVMLLLSGCSMNTVDKLYCLPRRSEEFSNLQAAIDDNMTGLEYCAPRAGEHQQTVQMADLDGDGIEEYLVFAKGYSDNPMKILIFDRVNEEYRLIDTVASNGSAFDLVEYAQMDDTPGMELVVGHQLSGQVPRSVSVFSFRSGRAERVLTTNYAKMLTLDLDMDSFQELFVLKSGQTETDNGIAELYGMENAVMARLNEANMSRPVDKLKRILVGQLCDGELAVFAASSVEESALITDVFSVVHQTLVNVSFSNESGTSVQTMRNYYIYSDDIDNDGVIELPDLMNMQMPEGLPMSERRNLIRWYGMCADGSERDKLFTYHDFIGGWYMILERKWASRLTVQQNGSLTEFYIWSDNFERMEKVMTVFSLSGHDRDSFIADGNRFMLLEADSVTYAASLETAAIKYQITEESLVRNFHLIQQEWKTGET